MLSTVLARAGFRHRPASLNVKRRAPVVIVRKRELSLKTLWLEIGLGAGRDPTQDNLNEERESSVTAASGSSFGGVVLW